ncbi:MAG: hypothetical protein LUE90_01630 [Clostridiales bacterium]|nr:hypothetical protein [Clostridiales bacterium]
MKQSSFNAEWKGSWDMLKLEIKLDEKKIEAECKYTAENIYRALEQVFSYYKLIEEQTSDGTMWFYGSGDPRDYGSFGRIITSLREKPWFMDYVTKWVWYNSDDSESEDEFFRRGCFASLYKSVECGVMAGGKSGQYKALYFDLSVKQLRKYFSATDPNRAYRKIKRFLLSRNFSHVQYSGYHSDYRTTDLRIFDLIMEMNKQLPWLAKCVNRFEVTNVGARHDLMILFDDSVVDP